MLNEISSKAKPRLLAPIYSVLLIFSVVFANQGESTLVLLGRSLHLVSILTAFFILYYLASFRAAVFLAAAALGYALGEFGHRPPYESALLGLSFFIGLIFTEKDKTRTLQALLVVCIVTGIVMFLQIIGASEAFFVLTTHGYLADGRAVPVDLVSTFLVDYWSLGGNFLQGRPSGILHSNQFATFVIVITISLFLALQQKPSHIWTAVLAACAVLTLSKVLTVFIFLLFFFGKTRTHQAHRANCTLIAIYYLAFLLAYLIFFPGVVTTYFLNPHTIIASIAVRLIDILGQLNFDRVNLENLVAELMNAQSANPYSSAISETLIIEMRGASRVSFYTTLVGFSGQLAFMAAIIILFSVASHSFGNKVTEILRAFYMSPGIFLALGLAVFSLAADFSGMALFWLMAGISVAVPSRMIT